MKIMPTLDITTKQQPSFENQAATRGRPSPGQVAHTPSKQSVNRISYRYAASTHAVCWSSSVWTCGSPSCHSTRCSHVSIQRLHVSPSRNCDGRVRGKGGNDRVPGTERRWKATSRETHQRDTSQNAPKAQSLLRPRPITQRFLLSGSVYVDILRGEIAENMRMSLV